MSDLGAGVAEGIASFASRPAAQIAALPSNTTPWSARFSHGEQIHAHARAHTYTYTHMYM